MDRRERAEPERALSGAEPGQAGPAVPDLAALYKQHRHAMYRVAYATLRPSGLLDSAEDAVSAAIVSVMGKPLPRDVRDWEAFLVHAAKRKAQDIAKSAAVQRAGPPLGPEHDPPATGDLAEEVAEHADRQRSLGLLRASLSALDERQRLVALEYIGRERPRAEVAAELGVTPARVSQIKLEVLQVLHREMSRGEDPR